MCFVSSRPALYYNQDDLVCLHDQSGANNNRSSMTGLAQVKGRDALEITLKAKYDGDYYQHISIQLYIKICFMTLFVVYTHNEY